jgi:hypothetical protein
LGACSSTTFLYNRLDFILPWYLGDYVDLSRDQKKQLDHLLQPFLSWHRQQELPVYLTALKRLEANLDGPLTAEDIASISAEFEAAWFRLEGEALNWMLELGTKLSDEQVREFLEHLRKQQDEYREKYLGRSDEEFRKEAYENLLDNSQDYLGRLDWGQRAILEDASVALQRSDGFWLQERAVWLDRLELLLQRQPGWQQGILDAMARRDQTVSPQYLEAYAHNTRVIHQAFARLLNTRTDKQDRRLRKKLGNLRKDLETLIERGERDAA